MHRPESVANRPRRRVIAFLGIDMVYFTMAFFCRFRTDGAVFRSAGG